MVPRNLSVLQSSHGKSTACAGVVVGGNYLLTVIEIKKCNNLFQFIYIRKKYLFCGLGSLPGYENVEKA